jgi:hypothetical protein
MKSDRIKVPSRLVLWFFLVLWLPGAQAGEWTLKALMAQLAAVESNRVEYTEERNISLLGVPLYSAGEVLYRAPDYLKKTVREGGQGSYEIRGEQLRIEENGQVRELPLDAHPALMAFVASFRATLAGDLAALQRYYRLKLAGEPSNWTLTLIPTEPSMAAVIRDVVIHGSGAQLEQVTTREQGGDSSLLTIRGGSAR